MDFVLAILPKQIYRKTVVIATEVKEVCRYLHTFFPLQWLDDRRGGGTWGPKFRAPEHRGCNGWMIAAVVEQVMAVPPLLVFACCNGWMIAAVVKGIRWRAEWYQLVPSQDGGDRHGGESVA